MRVSNATIDALTKVLTGNGDDTAVAPYRSGPELVDFFNAFGKSDTYGPGFPSRWSYAKNTLHEFNGTEMMKSIIEGVLDPRRFLYSNYDIENAVNFLNKYLEYDGYKVIKIGKFYKLIIIEDELKVAQPILPGGAPNYNFVREQLEKSEKKILEGDFDGAITNARSLVEAVLLDIEHFLSEDALSTYDGNITKLYKRVRKLLSLNPNDELPDSLRRILSGLISLVEGLSSIRNDMSDAHVRRYKPHEHHARLAVNSAKTITDFLFSTFSYQNQKGLIKKVR